MRFNLFPRLLIVALLIIREGLNALKVISIESSPEFVSEGNDVSLRCKYDLESRKLFSVKWSKNSAEFFRFNPRGSTTKIIYFVRDIYVDLEKSDAERVYLTNFTAASSGLFKCEVTIDTVSFASVSVEREVKVNEVPAHEKPSATSRKSPTLSGDSSKSPSFAGNHLITGLLVVGSLYMGYIA